MIRTKKYILVKSRRIPSKIQLTNNKVPKWTPVEEYGGLNIYSLKDAKEVLEDLQSGEIEGHSANSLYKIMEICYCDIQPRR